jgi:2-hydroxychromene-2-carboxylate isomerase
LKCWPGRPGIEVRWRPFNLREILIEQNNIASSRNPIKMNYSWHDIERRAKRFAVPFAGRPPYPVDPQLLGLRVGVLAAAENWCVAYSQATFRAWFLEGEASGLPENVVSVLAGLGKPAAEILARAAKPEFEGG